MRVTIFPRMSAMRGCIQITCFGGYFCLFPPVKSYGGWHKLAAYWSPNGTPWHHAMVPIFRYRKEADCVCGEPDCTAPRKYAEPKAMTAKRTAGRLEARPHTNPQWKICEVGNEWDIWALTTRDNDEERAKLLVDRFNAFESGGAVALAWEALEEMLINEDCVCIASTIHPCRRCKVSIEEARRALSALEEAEK